MIRDLHRTPIRPGNYLRPSCPRIHIHRRNLRDRGIVTRLEPDFFEVHWKGEAWPTRYLKDTADSFTVLQPDDDYPAQLKDTNVHV